MEQCENTRNVTVFGKNKRKKTALLFNPRCKLWSCDYCAEINKDYWIHQAARGAIILTSEGQDLQFVTLTSRPYATPVQSVYFFKQNFPKLRKRMADHTNRWTVVTGIKWSYFVVPERHKSGVLHCHIIAATHVKSERDWKKEVFASGFGYIVDVQPLITPLKAAHYVAKYLHKGAGAEDWPKGFRRVRHSQNWPKENALPLPGWDWQTYKNEETVWIEKNALIDMGWEVVDKTT